MYKKASRYLSGLSRDTGESHFVREGRRAAQEYLSEERKKRQKISNIPAKEKTIKAEKRKNKKESQRIKEEKTRSELVTCKFCQKEVEKSLLHEHCFFYHDQATCKFCRNFVPLSTLHEHIKTVHGAEVYKDWLYLKSKPESISVKWEVYETPEHSTPMPCHNCGLIIGSDQFKIHNEKYCKKKRSR